MTNLFRLTAIKQVSKNDHATSSAQLESNNGGRDLRMGARAGPTFML